MSKNVLNANLAAFLGMIAISEGTYGHGDNGYNVLVGGELFHDYRHHPHQSVYLPHYKIFSTAAGRYQILSKFADAYTKSLHLPDFSPASQDAIAIQIFKEQHAYDDIIAGQFDRAVHKVSDIWASLPGAGYGQHENTLNTLRAAYVKQGGVVGYGVMS